MLKHIQGRATTEQRFCDTGQMHHKFAHRA